MADTRSSLLQRVLESPDADEPRLVYADYLIEEGDPRGEFISTQIHLRGKLSPSARAELKAKERALLDQHEEEWAKPASSIASEYLFMRGFIERVTAELEPFLEGCAELLAREPVRAVELECSGDLDDLLQSELLARVSSIALSGEVGDEGIRSLAASPKLAKVKNLNLSGIGMTADGAAALAASPHLGSLETLTLTNNEIGSEGLAAIASCESLSSLTSLFVARNGIDDEGVIQLARSPGMKTLLKLGLGGNEEISDDGVSALLKSRHLANLKRCELDVDVGDEVAKKLAKRFGAYD